MRVLGFCAVVGVLAVGAAHAWTYAPFLSDDALISLRYAERLITGHGLTWTDGEFVEGYSDFAWVILTAFFGFLGFDLVVVARALGVLGAAVAIIATSLRPSEASLSLVRTLSGGLLLALTAPLAVWSIGALEHGFMAGVLALSLWLLTLTGAPARRALLACLCLLVLLRADGAVLVAGMLLGFLFAAPSLTRLREAVVLGSFPLGALLAQLVFRRAYYGAWVPNTALVKVGFSVARVEHGMAHVGAWLPHGWPLLLGAAVALVGLVRTERRWLVPLTTSLVWTAYVATVGGDIFPAWRQLLFAIVPLGVVIADGAEAWWARAQQARPSVSRALRVALVLGFAALAVTYRRAQDADPQNKRGVDERWEFDGFSLGALMREAWADRRPLLAVDAAGALPYVSKLPSLDMLGLNDRYIATHPPPVVGLISTGHELGDGAYVWDRKPDILSLCGAGGAREPCFLGGKQLFNQPGFREQYQRMRYHSVNGRDLRGEIWVRREGGVIGVERAATRIVVPGWLLAQLAGSAELHDGRLQAAVSREEPAHLERLLIPAGRWLVNREVGFRCEGKSLAGRGSVLEVTADAHVDVLVGSETQAWVDQLVLERTDAVPQMVCDPRAAPAPLRIDSSQLMGSVVPGAYFLQPHGVEVPPDGVVIHVGVAPRQFEISVDGNDRYRVRFMAGDRTLGEVELPDQPRAGLAVQLLSPPAETTDLAVEMVGGDGRGSIGHLRPVAP